MKKKIDFLGVDFLGVDKNNINLAWEYLKKNVFKEDVERKADEIRKNFNVRNDEEGEKFLYGFSINQVIAKIFGGGEVESLLRIENDFAKYLGYTFETQLDNLEKSGFPNTLKQLK
jgi:hypothetical protein